MNRHRHGWASLRISCDRLSPQADDIATSTRTNSVLSDMRIAFQVDDRSRLATNLQDPTFSIPSAPQAQITTSPQATSQNTDNILVPSNPKPTYASRLHNRFQRRDSTASSHRNLLLAITVSQNRRIPPFRLPDISDAQPHNRIPPPIKRLP
ncbi:hypothetical protein J3459_022466 [Metarhizium acridum]|uniref:uncharacterized protein n=1 Tax=Metarhizium acridum TaxID=92637 RepID=UPI001C6C7B3C|nr:hypothetical protein J3458_002853 [Metarhizium acridum]KAG8428397.1 hypothetical protein J3459_022466 [Metarhizium acridum]